MLSLASRVEIAPSVEMPVLGIGTYKSVEGAEAYGSVRAALEVGYRGVDTASLYANEESVGRALRDSRIARGDLFVATKVWNDEQGHAGTLEACERSLRRLGLDHLDLYLVHWPSREHMAGTWRAMEELVARGRTRAVGVCNFQPHQLEELASLGGPFPAVDQIEHHPRLQQPELLVYARDAGLVLQAWAPVMRGRAAQVPEIAAIAERCGKTASQVCLRWILQHGLTAVPKSVHRDRIEENADVFDFELTRRDMRTIDVLDRHERLGPDPDAFVW